jgi:hypothetical protein
MRPGEATGGELGGIFATGLVLRSMVSVPLMKVKV